MTESLSFSAVLKNFLYIPAALFLAGLNTENFFILTCFMIADVILGIIRAIALDGGKAFKSYKLGAGVLSKCVTVIVPLVVVWAGKGANVDLTVLGQWSVGALILSQAYSILGHINAIRMGEDRSEWDAVSYILSKLRNVIEMLVVDSHSKKN